MLAERRIGEKWIAAALAALGALVFSGCGSDSDVPPPFGTTQDASAGDRSEADAAASDSTWDIGLDSFRDGPSDSSPDLRTDSAADRGGDSVPDRDGISDSGPDGTDAVDADSAAADRDMPETSRPDGGPVNGPGCGGCFADELQAGGQCITNASCGSPPNAVMLRTNGVCQIHSCHPGWGDCDGRADTGCETDFTRPENCGRCGNMCTGGQVCGQAGCVSACAPPSTDCGGSCVDVSSSPLHCGSCFQPCNELQWHRPTCTNGVCGNEKICPPGTAPCSSGCSLLDEDPSNCGMCGRVCPTPAGGTVSCRVGVCIPHCPTGFTTCGSACVDLQSDPAHCGACGLACDAGGCVAGACDSSWSSVVTTGTAPTALAVDGTSLYWLETQAGRVMKAPKTGGTAVPLATGQATPFDLALDANNVYWSNRTGNAVMRIAKAGGGSPEPVVTVTQPMHIATDGTFVFIEQPPTLDAGVLATTSPGEAPPPIVQRTRIGTGVAEDFWVFPNGDTDGTLTRMLVDDRFLYWAGRRSTVPTNYFTFQIDKDNGATLRSYPGVWGELAQDESHIYMTTGSGTAGVPMTVAAIGKEGGTGWGIVQFQPGGVYAAGGHMAAGDTYLYRSSAGEFAGVHKFLKCGSHNAPVNLTGADGWSYLVADGPYVYGIFGTQIRRVHR